MTRILFLALGLSLVSLSSAAPTVTPAGAFIGQEALCFAFAPTGTQFAAGMADMSVKVFDVKTRATLKTFKGHRLGVQAIDWSPKADKIASGDGKAEIRVWDVKTGASYSLTGHLRGIIALDFNPTAGKLVSTGDDDVVKVWDLQKRKAVVNILGKGANLYGARFDSTGTKILIATLGKGLCVYSASNGQLLKAFGGHGSLGVNQLANHDKLGRYFSAGRDGSIGVWSPKLDKPIAYLKGHTDWVVNVAVSPNGKFLASSSSDGTVRVWDIKTLTCIATLKDQSYVGAPLAWSPSSGYLLTCAKDNFIRAYIVTP